MFVRCLLLFIFASENLKNRKLMKSFRDRAYIAFFLIGFVMLILGVGGLVSLGIVLKDWIPARGVVERIESERVYKYRKMRWRSSAK